MKPRYSKVLRWIGQNLEQVGLKALEVKTHRGNYIVQAWKKGASSSLDDELRKAFSEVSKKR